MYLPKHFAETDTATLQALIALHPLATWIAAAEDGLVANHLPFMLDPTRGSHGTLMGHVARANAAWQSFSTTIESLVVFQGSNAYITPSWYASKAKTGEVVPTWNYAVVHAHGMPRVIEDRDWLLDHVMRLTDRQEAGEAQPWKASDAPARYIGRMLDNIVGIEIPISRLTGKWKVSQNRPREDRLGVVAGLRSRGSEMADLVEQRIATPSS